MLPILVCTFAQLKVKVVKALAAREQQARRRNLTKYIPNAAQAIFTVTAGSDSLRVWTERELASHPEHRAF
jgi:hypothetical protein